jgi:hypothetical protein
MMETKTFELLVFSLPLTPLITQYDFSVINHNYNQSVAMCLLLVLHCGIGKLCLTLMILTTRFCLFELYHHACC